jgi:surface protein
MALMFYGTPFNQDLSGWNTSQVTDMSRAFYGATSFNQDISMWDTSKVTNMALMFYGTPFNQPIGDWNTSSVVQTSEMFEFSAFNQDIGTWDMSHVTEPSGMFWGSPFNQDISGWDMSSATNFGSMFRDDTVFNQNISGWNTASLIDMNYMFAGATSFDQNLGSWDVADVLDMNSMFEGDTLSTANYDAILNGWAAQSVQSGVPFNAGNSQYSSVGQSARDDTLIGIYGWSITDGGMVVCEDDSDCGLCEKCSVNTCVYESSSEDTKAECTQGSWSYSSTCTENRDSDFCDGSGLCGTDYQYVPALTDTYDECSAGFDSCTNGYTLQGSNGYCSGSSSSCDASLNRANVTAGQVCIAGVSSVPDASNKCGTWSDCLLHNTTAPEYYVGYVGDGTGTCVATNWVSAGTYQDASPNYWWSMTGQVDTCSEVYFCLNDSACGACQKCSESVCVYQNSSEDTKEECEADIFSCPNRYSYDTTTGFCDGAGLCGDLNIHVSAGKVCINSTDYNSVPTSDYKCGTWSDCLIYNTTAPEYYIGYASSGTSCNDTGWVSAETYQNATAGYRWSLTGHYDQCSEEVYCTLDSDCSACKVCNVTLGVCQNALVGTDVKDDCTPGFSSCYNIAVMSGPNGDCNGYGACDLSSNRVNVSVGKVCLAGSETDPGASAYCGIWSDCAYHGTTASEYYVGVIGNGVAQCVDTNWQVTGTQQNATSGYWWAATGHFDQCLGELFGECGIDSDCGPCKVCQNATCVNELATEDTKNDCTEGFNACLDDYTRMGPNGLCNGAGSCDTNSNRANVSENRICYNGEDRLPCGFWDYCLSHGTSADRYATGVIEVIEGNDVCIETGWVAFGQSYPTTGYYWATTELKEASGTSNQCAQIEIPGYCFSDSECGLCNRCMDGVCVNETDAEDVKNECPADSCFNDYTFFGSNKTGFCDGVGSCKVNNGADVYSNVSKGKVCIDGANANPTAGVYCGIWSNCYYDATSANEYYVGYNGDGNASSCSFDDNSSSATWVATGTQQNATPGTVFWTQYNFQPYNPLEIDQCIEVECLLNGDCGVCEKCSANVCVPQSFNEDLKNECTVDYDSCMTQYIRQSSFGSGYCNGLGACDNVTTGYKDVTAGNVCINGSDTAPTALVHCDDRWSDCVRYATSADEYYVGYTGTGVNICDASNWVSAGTQQTTSVGYWDATGRFSECTAVNCSQDSDCGFCNKCQMGSCVLENSTEDTKGECNVQYSNCTNAWTLHGADSTGNCDGAGACDATPDPFEEANVTIGNVCQGGLDTNPNPTVHCGIWSNCQLHAITAPEYYVGYRGNGSDVCVSTDWKYTGTNQTASSRMWWSMFGYMDDCPEEHACSLPRTGIITYGIYPAYDDCYIDNLDFENNIIIDCHGFGLVKNGTSNSMLDMINNRNVSIYNCAVNETSSGRQPLYLSNAQDILLNNCTFLYADTPSSDLAYVHNSSLAMRYSLFSDIVIDLDGASVVDYAYNVVDESGAQFIRLTSNGGTSVMLMHDSNFTADTIHFKIKRTVEGDNFTLYFYNNTVTANHVKYPVFGDSMTTPDVADFFSNRYYVGIVELWPAISDPMATLFDINLTGWFGNSNDLFTNRVNLIVNNSMIADGNASSDRTILGDGLMLYDTNLGSDANLTLVGFIFNNSIYDFGNGTYVNNTILYVSSGDISIASAGIYPFEGEVTSPVVSMSVLDEFSTVEAVNLTLTHVGNTTNLTKEASCDPLTNECTIPLNFYDPTGDYNYTSVLVKDRFGSTPEYSIFGGIKYYLLTALMKDREFVTFSGSLIGVPNVKCDVPIQLINSGNGEITNITLIAYDLVGETDPTKIIPASSFRAGDILQNSVQLNNSVPVQLSLSLDPGNKSYINLNLWISAPADTYPQSYYSPHSWALSIS